MNNLSFETTDWELEAQRVKRAFGLDGNYQFRCPEHNDKERFFLLEDAAIPLALPLRDINCGQGFAWYGEVQRFFGVARYSFGIGVWIKWKDGLTVVKHQHDSETADGRDAMKLAQTLFHLDLLTPEVEAALKVSISAHQKLEWHLEYEARYEL